MGFLDDLMGRPDVPQHGVDPKGDDVHAIGGVVDPESPGTPPNIPVAPSGYEPNAGSAMLADRLAARVPQLDAATLTALGEQLLHAYTVSDSYLGDAHDAVREADTEQADVASGYPGAILAMIEFSKLHPGVLASAVEAFERKHPGALGG